MRGSKEERKGKVQIHPIPGGVYEAGREPLRTISDVAFPNHAGAGEMGTLTTVDRPYTQRSARLSINDVMLYQIPEFLLKLGSCWSGFPLRPVPHPGGFSP